MKLIKIGIVLNLLSLIAVSCAGFWPTQLTETSAVQTGSAPIVDISKTPKAVYTATAKPESTPTTIPEPEEPIAISKPDILDNRLNYELSAVLDYGWRLLTVKQVISIPNNSNDIIQELTLVVQPNWRSDVINITDISWENGEPVNSFVLDRTLLRILLIETLDPGDSVKLSIAYEIKIPPILTSEDFGPNPFGYTSRQINLTDWYPFVPPYVDGEGWLTHNPWYYGEHLVYPTADFDVTIQVHNTPPNTLIAASGLNLGDGDTARYHTVGARNFVWSVSHEYQLFKEQVGNTTVLGYAFPYDIVSGQAAFRTTVEAMKLFNELYGAYPFESMTQVQADFEHGMEYSGFYFLSKAFYNTYDGTPSTYLVAIAAHETAHQWWYGLVGNDQALEPWLDEALCTYSEKVFYENLYPKEVDWWEFARLKYYEPEGWVDSTIYNTTSYRAYRDAVYLQGALFLDELRVRVGDDAFYQFLKDYNKRMSYKQTTKADFFTILQEHSDVEWGDILARYFEYP